MAPGSLGCTAAGDDAPKLPFDQHELAAMVAPRALLAIGNPDIQYLASESGYVSMKAAAEVWKALGVPDKVGFSQVGGLGMNTTTSSARSSYSTSLTRWIDWQTPTLN